MERHGNVLIVPAEMDPETWNRKVGAYQHRLMASVASTAGGAPPGP